MARKKYQRTLRNIERLERELGFVEQPPSRLSDYFETYPGAMWVVDNPADVQFLPPSSTHSASML